MCMCWNEIAKRINFDFFKHQNMDTDKQMFLTGITVRNLSVLRASCLSVGISDKYELISETCIKRDTFYNGENIGSRFSVYSK
jgi:hypothetical protein